MASDSLLYIAPTVVVKDVEQRGRALVATADLPAGKLILMEKPSAFFVLSEGQTEPTEVTLLLTLQLLDAAVPVAERAVDGLMPRSNQEATALMETYDTAKQWAAVAETTLPKLSERQRATLEAVAGKMAVDCNFALQRLMLMVMINALGPGHDTLTQQLIGIFPMASNINNSCKPNALHFLNPNKDMSDPELVVRLADDVTAGQEILFAYTEPLQPRTERQSLMRTHYFFECACPRCVGQQPWDTLEAVLEGVDPAAATAVKEEFDALQITDELPKWEKYLRRAEKVLEPHHHTLCETRLVVGQKHEKKKNWSKALKCYEDLLRAVELKVYPKGWSSLLMVHMRLYTCFVNLDRREEAEREKGILENLRVLCRGPRCGGCGKILMQPRYCSACNKAAYCTVECQKTHWKRGHKKECGGGGGGGGK